MVARAAAALLIVSFLQAQQPATDWDRMLKGTTFGLADAIEKGMKEAGPGVAFHAELENDKARAVYSIDIAQGAKTCNVVLDGKEGTMAEKSIEDEDHSDVAKSAGVGLAAAIATAIKHVPGAPVEAEMAVKDGKSVVTVRVFAQSKITVVRVDGANGSILSAKSVKEKTDKPGKPFTDAFHVDEADWTATGSNPYFVLEPGYFLVLEGKDEGQDARLTITVLDEVRKIAGVETRVVEEREEVGGKLIEVSRNFFAMSKKTNSVYYFGEEVDIYKDGKVASHDGAWVAGEKAARFGMMMPGTVLLGARYYQEVAPDVAMDRAEIVGMNETVETPAGKLDRCLKTEESTPLEKGKEHKLYAPGIGLVQENDLKLAQYGRTKK